MLLSALHDTNDPRSQRESNSLGTRRSNILIDTSELITETMDAGERVQRQKKYAE